MDEKWRVHCVALVFYHAWGIYPPGWPLDGRALMLYPSWRQAFQSAFDRAQFAHSPAPPH